MRDSTKTKEKILASAEKVFAKKGLTGTRMHEIARLASVHPALLHHYYTNKETLYLKVIERATQNMGQFQSLFVSPQGSYQERLFQLIDAGFEFCYENRSYLTIVQRDVADGGYGLKKVQMHLRSLLRAGIDFFQEGMDKGYLKKGDARDFVFTMYSFVTHYFYENPILTALWKEGPFSKKRRELRKKHVRYFFEQITRR